MRFDSYLASEHTREQWEEQNKEEGKRIKAAKLRKRENERNFRFFKLIKTATSTFKAKQKENKKKFEIDN